MARNHVLRDRFDLIVRVVLAAMFAGLAGLYLHNAFAYAAAANIGKSTLEITLNSFSTLAIGFYSFSIACLYVIRLKPVNKFAGPLPTITALIGGFLICGLMFLHPRTDLPVGYKLLSASLIIIGNVFTIVALNSLGRSFSILPEGRKLIRKGLYRYIRHPVYAAEAIATLGAMIGFLSPAAVALVVTQFTLQLCRIHFEEKVLSATFPEYKKYCRKTARLIPGIY